MPIEIDSSEIIAYLACRPDSNDQLCLDYQEIWDIGYRMEKANSAIISECDLMSVDAFRCKFPDYVKMEQDNLLIDNIPDIYSQLENLQPAPDIIKLIDEILNF